MDFYGFKRECYLKSVPSVDLDEVSEENPIKCSDYKLLCSVCDEIQEKYCKTKDEIYATNIWLLQSGPQLVEG